MNWKILIVKGTKTMKTYLIRSSVHAYLHSADKIKETVFSLKYSVVNYSTARKSCSCGTAVRMLNGWMGIADHAKKAENSEN